MNATSAEFSLYAESGLDDIELDETELDFSPWARLHFKDAYDFGRACRSLAIPVKSREEFAAV